MSNQAPQNPYEFTREAYDALVKGTPNCHVSQRSKYEEMELVDDCTLFDIYRQPRAPVTDPKVTKSLPVRVLNADLTCPICLGIIKETMVVMECLHRFCGECISTAIRQSKRECPSCRIHIPSKRSLRPDTNFDALITKIHPNLAEFERNEDRIIEQLNRSKHFNNAYTESTRMGVLSQAASRRNVRWKEEVGGGINVRVRIFITYSVPVERIERIVAFNESSRKKPRVATSTLSTSTVTDRVNLRVLLHQEEQPHAPKLQRTLFTTSSKLKIRHLKKHLCNLLKLDSYHNMCIVLPKVNCKLSGLSSSTKTLSSSGVRQDLQCDQELEDFVTVKDIYQQYGMGTEWELRLLYHFSPGTIVNGLAQFVSVPSGV
ncbi:hypothetical protein JM18_000605 [Phytophthora kernoviae]|uniref:RING-type E3 ubiquitin transferase n=2 Tax=Phytophthora kernoviae TaxID=325452 RepID=A0A8T0M922_9STRA|nr:hypothetical protein G195_001475 [Phytophthora kernoviae 00238/432]KAG2532176.1 hypothetical protein JM16_000524 [Phytophthora kernoviae]KAG2533169.1 hypothetical protein JM18_000605 [Phytophthora kernoviae]